MIKIRLVVKLGMSITKRLSLFPTCLRRSVCALQTFIDIAEEA